jgi:hypothetical protein
MSKGSIIEFPSGRYRGMLLSMLLCTTDAAIGMIQSI